jgi:inward rectifier potassium channel
MAISKQKPAFDPTTGFGTNSNQSGGRFYRADGKPNIVKRGVGILEGYSWYHTLLAMPGWKFFSLLFCIYILVNLLFAGVYYLVGMDHLGGISLGSRMHNFSEVFFFSTQTFTTVGYGRISPVGFLASAISTFEAFLGLLSFAIATGLFYGRFSRPQAHLRFSDFAVVAPYKDSIALMLRTVPFRNNELTDAESKMMAAMHVNEGTGKVNRFFPLEIEFSKINALVLNWTIVHPITEESPLYGMTLEDMRNSRLEIIVMVKAFDNAYSNTVVARTSYLASEIIWGAKFKPMYHPDETGAVTVLDVHHLNSIEKIELPFIVQTAAV